MLVQDKRVKQQPNKHAINPKLFRVPKMNLKNGHVS
jgi:hypothetical protein